MLIKIRYLEGPPNTRTYHLGKRGKTMHICGHLIRAFSLPNNNNTHIHTHSTIQFTELFYPLPFTKQNKFLKWKSQLKCLQIQRAGQLNKQTEAEQYCAVHRSNGPQPIDVCGNIGLVLSDLPSYFQTKPKLNFFHKKKSKF